MASYGFGATRKANANGYLRGIQILVAEDAEMSRQIIRDILKVLGANRLHYANDGMQALSIARATSVDLALIDWEMPVLSGLEFVRMIRTSEDSPNVFLPIIMLSSNSEVHHVTAARDAGVNEYLIKPFSARQLLQRIQTVIERPRPFIKTTSYFGPDRRRRKDEKYKGRERRKQADPTSGVHVEE